MSDAEQLARLRVAAVTGSLPPDLGKWALGVIESRMSAADRLRARNAALVSAARVHGGTRYAAAQDILTALQLLRVSGERLARHEAGTFAQQVQLAWRIDPTRPRTLRQLLAILR